MELLKLAWRGFLRFRGNRRHLTLIIIVGFFFSVFFLSLFGSLVENQRSYWGKTLLGTGSIVSKNRILLFQPSLRSAFGLSRWVVSATLPSLCRSPGLTTVYTGHTVRIFGYRFSVRGGTRAIECLDRRIHRRDCRIQGCT